MELNWQLADAKNRFSEVVRLALAEGPQRITRRDEAVVLMAESDYQRLVGEKPGFVEYLMTGPSLEDLDLERDQSSMRDIDL